MGIAKTFKEKEVNKRLRNDLYTIAEQFVYFVRGKNPRTFYFGPPIEKDGKITGRCPFHEDSNSSFVLDINKQLFHCFGCGIGGDRVTFQELMGKKIDDYLEPIMGPDDNLGPFEWRNMHIVSLRWGLHKNLRHTLKETGEIHGISIARVRQVEAKATRKLAGMNRN